MVPPRGRFSIRCTRCPRLAKHLAAIRRERPDYHARPVPSFGDSGAPLLIVGLAPGMHGANRTGRPFTGDFAGILLYQTLFQCGLASQSKATAPDDGLCLINCRITNAVRCLPPENKPTTEEVKTCNGYLDNELASVPDRGVILALGGIAHRAVLRALELKQSTHPFGHGERFPLTRDRWLLDTYHCSRYNTQTRRLTEKMFRDVVDDACRLVGL